MSSIRKRIVAARKKPKLPEESRSDRGSVLRKPRGKERRLGWKEDSLGYRSMRVTWDIWGRKQTDYGSMTTWFKVCGWEIHLVKIFLRKHWLWRGVAYSGGNTVVTRRVKLPRGTSDAKALNEMFRERLKVTFKI